MDGPRRGIRGGLRAGGRGRAARTGGARGLRARDPRREGRAGLGVRPPRRLYGVRRREGRCGRRDSAGRPHGGRREGHRVPRHALAGVPACEHGDVPARRPRRVGCEIGDRTGRGGTVNRGKDSGRQPHPAVGPRDGRLRGRRRARREHAREVLGCKTARRGHRRLRRGQAREVGARRRAR